MGLPTVTKRSYLSFCLIYANKKPTNIEKLRLGRWLVCVHNGSLANHVRDLDREPRRQLWCRCCCCCLRIKPFCEEEEEKHPLNKRTPRAIAWAMPNFPTLRAHKGLKWSVRQILPPLHSLVVRRCRKNFNGLFKKSSSLRTGTSSPSCRQAPAAGSRARCSGTSPESARHGV